MANCKLMFCVTLMVKHKVCQKDTKTIIPTVHYVEDKVVFLFQNLVVMFSYNALLYHTNTYVTGERLVSKLNNKHTNPLFKHVLFQFACK